jgi:hypothetical protein
MMPVKLRNPIVRAPILRKGGAHVKAKSSQRAKVKKEIHKAVNEWATDNRQF